MNLWFRGLRVRLLFFVVVPCLMMAGMAVHSYKIAHGLSDSLSKTNRVRLPLATYSGDMATSLNGAIRFYWAAVSGEAGDPKVLAEQCLKYVARYSAAAKEFEALPRPEWSREIYREIPTRWPKVEAALREGLKFAETPSAENHKKAIRLIVDVIRPETNAIEARFHELDEKRLKLSREETDAMEASTERSLQWMEVVSFLSCLGLLATGIGFARHLATSFSSVATGIAQSVQQFNAASTQLSSASQTLSSGASEAASSLEETVASIEELSSMVKQNAEHAKEAGQLSTVARGSAEQGEGEVRKLVEAMRDISGSSKKIEEITAVIDDLAFQTNLLALNAAVEAARAGEQGKGFAVVAEAVRNLAQRSGEAAKNINVLIKESVEKVDRGGAIADRSGDVLREIVVSVKKVADLNQEIASASQEQATGLSQISKAMNQLDQATQGNAASSEETAASSEELSAEARSLGGLVDLLRKVIDGGESGAYQVDSSQHAPTFSGSQHVASSKSAATKVLPFSPKSASPKYPLGEQSRAGRSAADAIPFDEEAPGKVGNLKGF